ncbi:MAG: DUF1499 domain-containing protein [Roseibium sp.]
MKRFAVHRTSSAPLSRTLGAIALALVLITLVTKRFDLINADTFVLSFGIAAAIAAAAVLAAMGAMQRIWSLGGPGLGSALAGMLFGVLALIPPAAILGIVIVQPDLQDVSTDVNAPPSLKVTEVVIDQPVVNWMNHTLETKIWPKVTSSGNGIDADIDIQNSLYPDIVSRRYRIPPGQLHAASLKAVDTLGWNIVDELPPDLLDAPTHLQVEGSTPILGLKQDVAVRIQPDPVGALLDVRSRSRTPLRDFTGNADRIRIVLAEIDRVLLETYGDLARLSVEADELEEDLPQDTAEPVRDLIPLPGFKPYFEDEDGLSPDEFGFIELQG